MKSGERILWLDRLRGIAMIMVVLSHSRVESCLVAKICWCCHVPLFFIISGMILECSVDKYNKTNSLEFIKTKTCGLMYPYITLSIIEIIVELFTNKEGVLNSIWLFISLDGIGPLWFIPTLWFATLFWYHIRYCKSRLLITTIIFIISLILSQYIVLKDEPISCLYIIARIMCATIFLIIGNICFRNLKIISKYRKIVILFGCISYIYGVFYFYSNSFDFHYANIPKPISFWFITLGTSLFWIVIVSKLKFKVLNKWFLFVGKNTLIILEGHWIILQLLKINPYVKCLRMERNLHEVIIFAIVMIILFPIIQIVNDKFLWIIKPTFWIRKANG